ncbi:hypothetical protein SAY87_019067 [Trapa incisa]|uniref:Uncharacterized protein n=1 Tax=Trapa incisa TaxID=236973 RepID=A0AAN7K0Z4_9MYRT|nr:hypothetical protein SAY87_019067 [Trapa incisa]
MAAEDDWASKALKNDALVAALLVRLMEPRASALVKAAATPVLPTWQWGFRKRRKQLVFRCKTAPSCKSADSRRSSPMTPLSWSAGTASSSGTADYYEESDVPACGSSRSKVNITATDSTSALDSKLKRKTFAGLKEEESLLLKERDHLRKKMDTLNITLDKETLRNETLKGMKTSFSSNKRKQAHKAARSDAAPMSAMDKLLVPSTLEEDKFLRMMPPQAAAAVHNYNTTTSDVPRGLGPGPGPASAPAPIEKPNTYFVLPDLNLTPSED